MSVRTPSRTLVHYGTWQCTSELAIVVSSSCSTGRASWVKAWMSMGMRRNPVEKLHNSGPGSCINRTSVL